jgi:hypothetical protein
MFEYLKRIASRLRFRAGGPPPASLPDDPEAGVREPRWRRGPGGSAAVAVAEPRDPDPVVAAIGRDIRRLG